MSRIGGSSVPVVGDRDFQAVRTASYTQYLIAPHWNKGKSLSTLEAADLNGDGVPDLWAVTSDGTARAYIVSSLSATGPAEITPQRVQKLS